VCEPNESWQVVLAGPVAPPPARKSTSGGGDWRELDRLGATDGVAAEPDSNELEQSSGARVVEGRPGELGAARAWWIWGSRVLAAVQTYTVRGKNETCAPVGPNVGANIFVRRLSAHLTTNCWSGLFPDRSYVAYYTKYRPKL
jgi:hypothetical protein